LIPADNHFALWTILLLASAFGMIGERKGWFGQLSGVLVTIIFTAILTTIGLIPSASDATIEVPVYSFIFTFIIPVSIPLLLFGVNIKRILNESGRLLGIYLIGALGVVLGAIIAAFVVPLGEETYKVAGVFIGTYTGGSVNFMAVAGTLDFFDSPLFSSTIAVDNVFTNLYIMGLFLLPAMHWLSKYFSKYEEQEEEESVQVEENQAKGGLMEQITVILSIGGIICAIGYTLGPWLSETLGTDIDLNLLLVTLLIVLVANFFADFLKPYEAMAFDIGMFLMYVFLAVIGAASDLVEMVTSTPGILIFAAITLLVHLVVSLIGGKLLGLSLEEIAIASCANSGGASVAAPMAATFKMKKAVTPAILIGMLGYVIGTFLGVAVGLWLQ
jgi:uncharacterized membrane protein